MKEMIRPIAFVIGGLFAALVIGRVTGLLGYYSIPTPSMEPTLMAGSRILTSNIVSAERGDLVCFEFPLSDAGDIYVNRLCAVSGDEIEMKNGVLFVNGKSADEALELKHLYKISASHFNMLLRHELSEGDVAFNGANLPNGGGSVVFIKDQVAWELGYQQKQALPHGDGYPDIIGDGDLDNFGPLTVPNGMWFMLGDNRDNSYDSRTWGWCPEENFKATVITIF